jgi:hypothetical protein
LGMGARKKRHNQRECESNARYDPTHRLTSGLNLLRNTQCGHSIACKEQFTNLGLI